MTVLRALLRTMAVSAQTLPTSAAREHSNFHGRMPLSRQLKRRLVLAFFQKLPPCLVGIEACASAHHWHINGSFWREAAVRHMR